MSDVTEETRSLVGAYHRAWTSNDHEAFHSFLHEDVVFDFPLEIRWPAGTVTELLAELVDGEQAVQIYDATSPAGESVRVAEHLTLKYANQNVSTLTLAVVDPLLEIVRTGPSGAIIVVFLARTGGSEAT